VSVLDPQAVCAFIHKPAGITSHDLIAQLRKAFPGLKVGHGGTLDPFATGVLPVFFGKWTKLTSLFSFADKRYKAQIDLGTATDTGDWTGTVTQKKNIPPYTEFQMNLLQRQLHGEIDLPIPMYSALKVNGTPMYELARKGVLTQSIRSRKTILYQVTLSAGALGHQLLLDVTCSHGTYIRSLGEYIAHKLKTVGHLSALERVSYGQPTQPFPFVSVALEDFKKHPEKGLIYMDQLHQWLPTYRVSASNLRNFYLGKQKYIPFRRDGWRIAYYDSQIVAVILTEKGKITQRIFTPWKPFTPDLDSYHKKQSLPRLSYFDA